MVISDVYLKNRKERRLLAAIAAVMKVKGKIVSVVCLLGLFLSGCGQGQDNDSALAAVNKNIPEDDGFYKENEPVRGEDYTENADKDEYLPENEAADRMEEPENGHIITHNPNYRAPARVPDSSKGADGYVFDGAFIYQIPEGYTDSIIDGSLVYVLEEEKGSHSIYIYTEDIAGLYPEDVLSDYDISVKETFGINAVSDEKEYNGLTFTHYLYDDLSGEEHGFINVFVHASNAGFIYVELYDGSAVYDEAKMNQLMDSISLTH